MKDDDEEIVLDCEECGVTLPEDMALVVFVGDRDMIVVCPECYDKLNGLTGDVS